MCFFAMMWLFGVSWLWAKPPEVVGIVVQKEPLNCPMLWQVAERHKFSLSFRLPTQKESGTGFFWKGRMWTSYHLIAGAYELGVRAERGFVAPTLIDADPIEDHAIFDMEGTKRSLKTAKMVEAGEPIVCAGFAQGNEYKEIRGTILAVDVITQIRRHTSVPLIEVDCHVVEGMSGGPVLNNDRELVGMIIASEVGRNAYVMPHWRLGRQESMSLGIWFDRNTIVASERENIVSGQEVLSIQRGNNTEHTNLARLHSEEEISLQFTNREVVIQPRSKVLREQTLFVEEGEQLRVLFPSDEAASLGLLPNDLTLPSKDANPWVLSPIWRGNQKLYVLRPQSQE
ncbi:MAG: serine protease [Myxococcota bacterium]|nr:serine protease [Myxococcota bacterium]